MKKYFSQLTEKLENEITKISNSDQTEIQKCESCRLLIFKYYQELRKFMSNYQFKSEQEEINYFRNLKPELVATFTFYYKKSKIIKQHFFSDSEITKNYLQYELQKVEKFHLQHLDFISYYNSGQTNFDEILFLRKNLDLSTIPSYILLRDDLGHTTNGDYLVTKLLLNAKLYKFIQKELIVPTEESLHQENTKTIKSGLNWTAPKSALIELSYALFCKGAINNGDVEIKQLISQFELFFNIELGDPYRHFTNIKQRKKSSAIFLESLTDSLTQYMNEQEELP
ncbi:MAG: RteC domain-containing protein [Brumimicrobium sp.]|nr:RteC domain-containing protein [Brumimicrobium sp.]